MAEREYTVIEVDKHVYYGKSNSLAASATKNVIIQNPTIYVDQSNYFLDLNEGDLLIVSFESGNENNAPTLNLQIPDGEYNISFSNGAGRAVIGSNISEDCTNMWDGCKINCGYYSAYREQWVSGETITRNASQGCPYGYYQV